MAHKTRPLAAATAVAAAFSLLATPVAAAELPRPAHAVAFDATALNVQRHDDWDDDWDDDDIDTGDVIAGVAVLGALAAIFWSSGKNRQQEPYRYPDDANYRYPEQQQRSQSGLAGAVDACVAVVERDGNSVGSVESASRDGDGWRVSGSLDDGARYACRVERDGQVSDINIGGYGVNYEEPADEQYGDDYYTTARKQQRDAELEEGVYGDDSGYEYETAEASNFAK